jgi:hypothetical protein
MVLARNTISGQIADVSPKILEHPKFKDILEVVDGDAKPYVAALYKPGTKQEKAASRLKKSKVEEVEVVEEELVAEDDITEIYPEIEEEI